MINKSAFEKVNEYEWIIPVSYHHSMQVPVRVFASNRILEAALKDNSVQQAVNAASLPGLVDEVKVMPDVHQGYGFPIGGVAATTYPSGVITPGGIGYDINCGVRLLASRISLEEIYPFLEDLLYSINRNCPSGVGSSGKLRLSQQELEKVCFKGAEWAVKRGFGDNEDLQRTESFGYISGADIEGLSDRAKKRGLPQLGSLGAGNHFIEIGVVDQVFFPDAARAMGLVEGNVTVMIHSGSRGLGHQVCSDFVQAFQRVVQKYKISIPDRELVCAPLDSKEGQSYLGAMKAAANYAFANRQVMAHYIRQSFLEILSGKVDDAHIHQVYDITHNMGNIETHYIDGKKTRLCIHRKGATRAFPPGSGALPPEYQPVGQPVLVPGSMGTSSWVLVGTEEGMKKSLGSSCHGAGRVMSRSKAKKSIRGDQLIKSLNKQGILVKAGSMPGLAEEAPQAYKDVDDVIEVVHGSGIAKKVARLIPVAVIKG